MNNKTKPRKDASCLRITPETAKHLKELKNKLRLFNPSIHSNDDVIKLLMAEYRIYSVV